MTVNLQMDKGGEAAKLATALQAAANDVYAINKDKGWFDAERTFGDDIALLHSEVSEMLEAFRDHGTEDVTIDLCKGHPEIDYLDNHICKPEGVGSEAADVLVRLLDTCYRYNIDLGHEFVKKIRFNNTRPQRHGNKRL